MDNRLDAMRRCHPDSVTISRITGFITDGVILLAAAAYLIIAAIFGWTLIPGWITIGLLVLGAWFTWAVPSFTYKQFGFKVSEEELELRSGWIWLSDTLVPMTRVQHVELERGPLLRKYGLAKVKVVTAATTHVIQALKLEDAEELKNRSASWPKWWITMNEPTRLHRLFILFPLVGSVKSLIPIAALVSIKFLNGKSLRDIPWYWLSAVIVIMVSLLLLYGYLKWKRFVYTLEEDKILIRRGVLFREELSIYTGRIHSMNMEQPLLQRILGLTQVRIETPGKTEGGGILPAITNSEGERLQRWLREQTRTRQTEREVHQAHESSDPTDQSFPAPSERAAVQPSETRENHESIQPSNQNMGYGSGLLEDSDSGGAAGRHTADDPGTAEEERSTLLQLSSGRLLIAALSSPNLSLALAFVGGIISFADDLLPDQMYQSLFQSAGSCCPGAGSALPRWRLLYPGCSPPCSTRSNMRDLPSSASENKSRSAAGCWRKRLLFSPERVLAITVKKAYSGAGSVTLK